MATRPGALEKSHKGALNGFDYILLYIYIRYMTYYVSFIGTATGATAKSMFMLLMYNMMG